LKYRSSTDIIAMILNATLFGETKGKIITKAQLNYTQLKMYLPLLIEKRLVEENVYTDKTIGYQTTEKGRIFLKIYNDGRVFDLTNSNHIVDKIKDCIIV
jgi:predicted transcriptional regulator